MKALLQSVFPVLNQIEPERANQAALYGLKMLGVKQPKPLAYPAIQQTIWKRTFLSPVGLAAGFDKDAKALGGHFHLGFGFAEVGTVTPRPQEGNEKPRVFKHPKTKSVINRLGFPSAGLEVFGRNLGQFHLNFEDHWGNIGVNIGINKDCTDPVADFRMGMQHLGAMADYVVLNMSSPNTKGLRDLQKPDQLRPILEAILEEREAIHDALPAVVVKVSPDISDEDVKPICDLLIDLKINGVIVSNTTLSRSDDLPDSFANETGGLSGPALADRSTALISKFYQHLKGRVIIIGCGGVSDADTAYKKIKAGAHLIQLYTALIYEGPAVVQKINKGLVKLVTADGYASISEAIGKDAIPSYSVQGSVE